MTPGFYTNDRCNTLSLTTNDLPTHRIGVLMGLAVYNRSVLIIHKLRTTTHMTFEMSLCLLVSLYNVVSYRMIYCVNIFKLKAKQTHRQEPMQKEPIKLGGRI